MNNEDNDQQLIDKLRQLPQIKDHRDKDELYQRISTHVEKPKTKKQMKFVPVFGTLAVIILVLAIIPTLMNISLTDKNGSNSGQESYMDQDSNDHDEAEMNVAPVEYRQEQEISMLASDVESYVYSSGNDESTIIYGAVTDDQLQTIIPITIVHPRPVDMGTAYNQIAHMINTIDWGVSEYLFGQMSFDIDLANHEVLLNIPGEFPLDGGLKNDHMIQEILTTMFTPYQIEKVVFSKNINLESFGNISELPLQEQGKANYKIFQANEQARKFLVPIKVGDDVTIKEAITNMKSGQQSLGIYPTLPKDIELTLLTMDDELHVAFDHDQIFEDEQAAIIMIEAILMTAKKFGYEFVQFDNITKEQIGPYKFTESIKVPEGVNPIYQ